MAASSQTLYIKGDKNKEVTKNEVLMGDIVSMECADQNIVNRLKSICILKMPEGGRQRAVISVLKIISVIHEIYPNLTVENLGETDMIVKPAETADDAAGNEAGQQGLQAEPPCAQSGEFVAFPQGGGQQRAVIHAHVPESGRGQPVSGGRVWPLTGKNSSLAKKAEKRLAKPGAFA